MTNKDFLSSCSDDEHLLVVLNWNASPLDKVHDFRAHHLRLILLDYMTAVSNDIHFVLALHVCNRQLGVLSLSASQKEHFLSLEAKERRCEASEPLRPELLRREKVGAPDVLF